VEPCPTPVAGTWRFAGSQRSKHVEPAPCIAARAYPARERAAGGLAQIDGEAWVGAWGPGPFDNDDAADWVSAVAASAELAVVRAALQAVLDAEHVAAPVGAVAIAAAELVAAAADAGRPEPPVELTRWLAAASSAPTLGDRDLALRAVLRTRSGGSELAEVWEETGDLDWFEQLDELVVRLASIPSRSLGVRRGPTGPSSAASAVAAEAHDAPPPEPEDVSAFPGHRRLWAARAEDLRTDPRRHEVRWLELHDVRAPDLQGLASWERLVDVEIDGRQLQRLDGLDQLPQLRHLQVGVGNRSLDLGGLAGVPALVSLWLFPADAVSDLSPIGQLDELRRLGVGHDDPVSAQRLAEVPFHRLAELEHFSWHANWQRPVTLTDLTPLAELAELRHVGFVDLVVDGPLDVLHRLPSLREVRISHPDAAVERERFAAIRPDVHLEISGPDLA
jgi:hypothetical protein